MSTEKSDSVLENQSHESIVSDVDRSPVTREPEWTPQRVKDYLKWSDGVEKLAMDFTAELAAERQRLDLADRDRCRMSERICELENQLLSAQTAIEKIAQIKPRSDLGACWRLENAIGIAQSVDLSLLHQHDAEVRKPLVDLLERAKWEVSAHAQLRIDIDAALAQCEEKE